MLDSLSPIVQRSTLLRRAHTKAALRAAICRSDRMTDTLTASPDAPGVAASAVAPLTCTDDRIHPCPGQAAVQGLVSLVTPALNSNLQGLNVGVHACALKPLAPAGGVPGPCQASIFGWTEPCGRPQSQPPR